MLGLAAVAALVGVSVGGCGSIPDAEVTYYKATTKVFVKVTRTVACNGQDVPLIADTVVPSVVHSADITKPEQFKLAALRGPFTDSDVKFELFEDGRLKSVNAAVTGQAEGAIKAAATFVTVLMAFDGTPPPHPVECAFIAKHGAGKPITLIYEAMIDPANAGRQSIAPDPASAPYAQALTKALPAPCAVVTEKVAGRVPVQYKPESQDLLLAVRQPAWLKFTVGTVTPGNGCSGKLWDGQVLVAQLGTDYVLPVPKAALFGKQTFGAGFSEAGSLTSIQYVSGSGAASALGAATSLATAAQGETTAAKAAAVKAEADLIAQQQRLVQCLADPKSCAK